MIFNVPALILAILAITGGSIYQAGRPPMSELESFLYFEEPPETDSWVHWQQRGSFAGREAETKTGRGLLLYRDELRRHLVEEARLLSGADFERQFGPPSVPNYCAISKQAIAATFALRYGGRPEDYDVWKHSRCKV
jgi:hypothetical protein